LTLLNDDEYGKGVKKLNDDLIGNPDKTVVCDFADMFIVAQKRY
jgi:hypothetical protein